MTTKMLHIYRSNSGDTQFNAVIYDNVDLKMTKAVTVRISTGHLEVPYVVLSLLICMCTI